MKIIQAEEHMNDEELKELGGHFVDMSHADILVGAEDATVLKPDGTPLIIYIKDAVPRKLCALAFEVLKQVEILGSGDNRGLAAGLVNEDKTNIRNHGDFGKLSGRGARFHTLKKDGTLSRTTYAAAVNSSIIGYYDRYPRIPFCRQTTFTRDNPELWSQILPYVQRVNSVFKEFAPEYYSRQEAFAKEVHKDFIIPGTAFGTITVNRSFRTALHTDKGDYANGLGCLTALEGGKYSGGETILPKYRAGFNARTGGVALYDVHQWHGNAPIVGNPGQYVRFSSVFYTREKARDCGSMEYELERAKEVGDKISKRHEEEILSGQTGLFD